MALSYRHGICALLCHTYITHKHSALNSDAGLILNRGINIPRHMDIELSL